MLRRPLLLLVLLLAAPARPAAAFDSLWSASGGVLPDSLCPPWTRGAGGGASIQFAGNGLQIQTGACGANAYFFQKAPDIAMPETLVVEARVRFDSGTECTGPCGHYRQAADIAITTGPHVGTLFFIGPGELFLTNGECAGITAVSAPTQDAAHDYRIVVRGTTVAVYQDGVYRLGGSTYSSLSDHADAPRILWGEGSSLAWGVSRWEYFRHNALAAGCATAAVDPVAASGLPRPVASPNPFRSATTLRFALAQAGRVRVEIFDASGRLVRRLFDGDAAEGAHAVAWDGADGSGRQARSGAFLYRVIDGARTRSGIVVKVR